MLSLLSTPTQGVWVSHYASPPETVCQGEGIGPVLAVRRHVPLAGGAEDHGGHYVGCNLNIDCFQRLKNDWYGEGDDMIFIDGDTKPTLCTARARRLREGYVLRTDEDGDVRVETDGVRLWVMTER